MGWLVPLHHTSVPLRTSLAEQLALRQFLSSQAAALSSLLPLSPLPFHSCPVDLVERSTASALLLLLECRDPVPLYHPSPTYRVSWRLNRYALAVSLC
jgi:hypothetical protein